MAETSGFFQAMWDESLLDPITGEYTGWWDRNYVASEFMKYFALFIGNGVFASPTNQLKVIPGAGMSVIVTEGWAFINGAWYHNDTNLTIPITSNSLANNRVDSVRVRFADSERFVRALVFTGDTNIVRGETIYDLQLAQITIPPFAVTISAANITDTRMNENVCGFVKGLMEVVSTADLFAQYNTMFSEWFDTVKDQVTGDLAIRLQREFEELNAKVDAYQAVVNTKVDAYQEEIKSDIAGYNANYQATLNESKGLIATYVDNDYVIPLKELTFVNKQCIIIDDKITANSLIDVYFNSATIEEAQRCQIFVDSIAEQIIFGAAEQPTKSLYAAIRVRVK